jgi:hypothetical protein
MLTSMDSVTDLKSRISDLESSFENTSLNLADSSSLLGLITNTNQRLSDMINGTIPTSLQYNTDVIYNGPGIIVDKSVPNKIKIKNDLKGYIFNKPFLWNESTSAVGTEVSDSSQYDPANASAYGIWTRLKEFSNQLRLVGKTVANTADNNINIYLDDKLTSWSDGQSFKVVFDGLDLNGNNISIWTNQLNGYTTQVGSIAAASVGNSPYFEIVCLDAANYKFEIDIIR